jgi:cell wall-associated NlpC family hydrolase
MTDVLSAIQNNIAAVNSAMAALPDELSAEASTGDFASVLAGVQQSLGLGTSTTATSTSSAGSALTGGLTTAMAPLDTMTSGTAAAADGTTTGSPPSGAQVVAEAQQFLGVPYVWGGSSPQGFDCSGLVQYVYGQLGVNLPRTSEEQATAGTAVDGLADAQPGDLLFFAGSDGTAASPGHVGIYIGNGQMIDAPETGEDVRSSRRAIP